MPLLFMYSLTTFATRGFALSCKIFMFLVPDVDCCFSMALTTDLRQYSMYVRALMVFPLSRQWIRRGPFDLNMTVIMHLGSNWPRWAIVLWDSPTPTHDEFDCLRPTCLQYIQDSSPVKTLHNCHLPSLNLAKFRRQKAARFAFELL